MHGQVRILTIVACAAMGCTGCAGAPSHAALGADATWRPGWHRGAASFQTAVRDPWVWAPLAGAAILQIDDWDDRSANWARDHRPIFGSVERADDWSDGLRSASLAITAGTLLIAPGGEDWWLNKGKAATVEVAAIGAASGVTHVLKSTAERERPNAEDDESFPSGHATIVAVATRLSAFNLDAVELRPGWRTTARVGLHAMTIGTAWARVEAGAHHPADTLVGMALGRLFGTFFTQAFLAPQTASFASVQPLDNGLFVHWGVGF